jgi:hypothetical protein
MSMKDKEGSKFCDKICSWTASQLLLEKGAHARKQKTRVQIIAVALELINMNRRKYHARTTCQ